ncbi:TIGR04211 family SH3 domain-containing protein [Pseudoalteromonas luteoviolacea]|uniref:TIGR04211 family SH3 domain-containing protein n=1 Tax=Pseudoalteromonas luteoviolacea TaxID=43657 RepID=UPI001154C19F|nr:TIGR04211 family SH3 domain-containing protein [Pseudoalteromonas luteoviolacea]TQF69824.1 TIGR04211 family SH3 domain-containing protein [Pseudoalteromonas luteoviolacea]
MFKKLALPLLFVFAPLTLHAQDLDETNPQEQTAQQNTPNGYIVDNLYLFMHSGPGTNYRILGSIEAGSPITITNEQSNDYVRIIDNKERSGWVESKFVTAEPGLKQQLNELSQALDVSQNQLAALQTSMPQLQSDYDSLESQNSELQKTIKDLNEQLELQAKSNQNKVEREQHLLLTYGGGIALGGVLLGVILTLLLSRRKRYDGWS